MSKASTEKGTSFLRKFPSISGAIYKTQEQPQGGKYNHSSNYYEWSDQTPCKASLFFILETSLSLENILIFKKLAHLPHCFLNVEKERKE